MAAYYSKEALAKEDEYFSYREQDCMDVFVEKIEKIIDNFANFLKQKMIFTEENYWKITGQRKLVIYVEMN